MFGGWKWSRLVATVPLLALALGLNAPAATAQTVLPDVFNQATFFSAMRTMALNRNDHYVINITASFAMSGDVAPVVLNDGFSLTVNGNGHTINGNNQYRPFFVSSSSPTTPNGPTVTINNLNINNGGAIGGTGSGGGMGAGGGVFVDQNANVVLDAVNFAGNTARGGAGRSATAGGGGLGGNGGLAADSQGGGGLYGIGGGGGGEGGGGGGALGNGGSGGGNFGGAGGGGSCYCRLTVRSGGADDCHI